MEEITVATNGRVECSALLWPLSELLWPKRTTQFCALWMEHLQKRRRVAGQDRQMVDMWLRWLARAMLHRAAATEAPLQLMENGWRYSGNAIAYLCLFWRAAAQPPAVSASSLLSRPTTSSNEGRSSGRGAQQSLQGQSGTG